MTKIGALPADKCSSKTRKRGVMGWERQRVSQPDVIDQRNKLEIMFVHAARFNFRVCGIELNSILAWRYGQRIPIRHPHPIPPGRVLSVFPVEAIVDIWATNGG